MGSHHNISRTRGPSVPTAGGRRSTSWPRSHTHLSRRCGPVPCLRTCRAGGRDSSTPASHRRRDSSASPAPRCRPRPSPRGCCRGGHRGRNDRRACLSASRRSRIRSQAAACALRGRRPCFRSSPRGSARP